jgi:hypothetical protein
VNPASHTNDETTMWRSEQFRKEWLTRELVVVDVLRELEDSNLPETIKDDFRKLIESLTARMTAGDELWYYDTAANSGRGGSVGIAIVRGGEIVYHEHTVAFKGPRKCD